MACDLARTPTTGLEVQACGDCHLLNFGLFATPERNLIFDLRDLDETIRAPWEWDLKRLATSFVVAGRLNGISDRRLRDVAAICAQSYRVHLREFSAMSPLEVWYFRVSAEDLVERAPGAKAKDQSELMAAKARKRIGENLFPKITEEVDGQHRFSRAATLDQYAVTGESCPDRIREGRSKTTGTHWRTTTLAPGFVFDRYFGSKISALRVVGIAQRRHCTRCYVGLFFCDDKNPLLLQIKESRVNRSSSRTRITAHLQIRDSRVVAGKRVGAVRQ